jgi:hypothetical protein
LSLRVQRQSGSQGETLSQRQRERELEREMERERERERESERESEREKQERYRIAMDPTEHASEFFP